MSKTKSLGGLSELRKDNLGEIQKMCDELQPEVEKKCGNPVFSMYVVKSYKTQLVAGTNFFVKIQVGLGERDYVHVRIIKPLPYTNKSPSVEKVKSGMSAADDIEYF